MEEDRSESKELMMVRKWTRGVSMVGKRAGPSTPSPAWRLQFYDPRDKDRKDNNHKGHGISEFLNFNAATLSARKLGANLWELHPHYPIPDSGGGAANLRRKPRRHREDKGLMESDDVGPPNTPPEPSEDSRSLKVYDAASMMQHPRAAGVCASAGIQPVSPSSGSSMELAPYDRDKAPSNPLDFKGRIGKASHGLKTSTELLKVLNRIWALEEQHVSNMELVKSLKKEVNHSHARIKDLMQAKQKERQEMNELVKQVVEDNLRKRSGEKARLKAAIQTVRDELEYESTLHDRSESSHKKLSKELSQVKHSFSYALKELERERKARISLENLCDEFAKGIKEYEHKLRNLKHKHGSSHVDDDEPEKLILHISEAWLDERIQMKQTEGPSTNNGEKIVDALDLDVETFLQGKHASGRREDSKTAVNEVNDNILRRYSLESFMLNESASAPRGAIDDDEDSCLSDSCYDLLDKKTKRLSSRNSSKNVRPSNSLKKNVVRSRNVSEGSLLHNYSLQRKCDHMPKTKTESAERSNEQADDKFRSEILKATPDDVQDREIEAADMVRRVSLSSKGDRIHSEINQGGELCPDSSFPECWLKSAPDVKENTLKAKLLEARLEGRRSHHHPSTSKTST